MQRISSLGKVERDKKKTSENSYQTKRNNEASRRKMKKSSLMKVAVRTSFPETWIWIEDKTKYVIS